MLAVLASGASGAGEAAGPTGSAIRSVPAAAAISDVATDPHMIVLNRSSVGHVVPTPALTFTQPKIGLLDWWTSAWKAQTS